MTLRFASSCMFLCFVPNPLLAIFEVILVKTSDSLNGTKSNLHPTHLIPHKVKMHLSK